METLYDSLSRLKEKEIIPMHMPGHKRNTGLSEYLNTLSADMDITEINGFDNLHSPCGILKSSMERAARIYGADNSFFLVNGSTCGILAGVRTVINRGDKILVSRNCHKSVYHAIELCSAHPVFILPDIDEEFGIFGSITPCKIEKALNEHKDIKLIMITSPTYEGVLSDIESICKIAHSYKIPVMVDEAHGAHLSLSGYFTGGALKSHADIVIQSLHKTMPGLTQTALAHISGNLVSKEKFMRQLGIFETSSPSYLLLASIDESIRLIEEKGDFLFKQWKNALEFFNEKISRLNALKILNYGNDLKNIHTDIFNFDKSKIIISTKNSNITGADLMKRLRESGIELEMAYGNYAVAMTGIGDTENSLEKLSRALLEIDRVLVYKPGESENFIFNNIPRQQLSIEQALNKKNLMFPLDLSSGNISADYLWAYPPGVPILIPGELITKDLTDKIKELQNTDTIITGIINGKIKITNSK